MENSTQLTPEQLEAVTAILGKKNEDQDFVKIEVPTRCKWYNVDEIYMRPFTFADEKAALNPANKKNNFLNFILERCIKGIEVESLFVVDRNYLAYKLKEISTGPNIQANITCASCGREGHLNVDLNILNINNVDVDLPLELHLEEIGKTVKINPPRVKDEAFMLSFEMICENVWRFVSEIDGVTDGVIINAVIEKLPVQDIHALLKAIGMSKFGIQNEIKYACVCEHEQVVEVPLTENFFGNS
jgi:hypothetical protein